MYGFTSRFITEEERKTIKKNMDSDKEYRYYINELFDKRSRKKNKKKFKLYDKL